MDIMLRGSKSVGKTAILQALAIRLENAGFKCGGVVCPIGSESSQVMGKIAVNLRTGEKWMLVAIEESLRMGREKHKPSTPGIEFGKRLIESASDSEVILVDDLGSIDLTNTGILEAIEEKIIPKDNLLVVVEGSLLPLFYGRFVERGFSVFEVTEKNRDQMVQRLEDYILKCLRK